MRRRSASETSASLTRPESASPSLPPSPLCLASEQRWHPACPSLLTWPRAVGRTALGRAPLGWQNQRINWHYHDHREHG